MRAGKAAQSSSQRARRTRAGNRRTGRRTFNLAAPRASRRPVEIEFGRAQLSDGEPPSAERQEACQSGGGRNSWAAKLCASVARVAAASKLPVQPSCFGRPRRHRRPALGVNGYRAHHRRASRDRADSKRSRNPSGLRDDVDGVAIAHAQGRLEAVEQWPRSSRASSVSSLIDAFGPLQQEAIGRLFAGMRS